MKSVVKAVQVERFNDLKEPGQYILTGHHGVEGKHGLMFRCPCGCGALGHLPFDSYTRPSYVTETWTWDGNETEPTLSPSIQRTSACRWHGFLKKGLFEEC